EIIRKEITFYVIDAYRIAKKYGLGRRINTIMQTCFFAISKILPEAKMLEEIKASIHKSYGKKSAAIVKQNLNAVDETLHNLFNVDTSPGVTSRRKFTPAIKGVTNDFVTNVTAHIIEGRGDELKVSQIPEDGTWQSGTTQYEKRNIALEVPFWNPDICIECNKCVTVCPHAVIRSKVVEDKLLDAAPKNFKSKPSKNKTFKPDNFTLNIAVEDCTGCAVCVEECPVTDKMDPRKKAITMVDKLPILDEGIEHWAYFDSLPNYDREKLDHTKMKEAQILEPLFEFSGACAGCGETPYLKLITQLFGDRMLVANATGCSSIYGGNLPTTPWTKNSEGRGPAWSNSLFEDNAEFGLGFRISIDKKREEAEELLTQLADQLHPTRIKAILEATQHEEREITAQRTRVEELKTALEALESREAKALLSLADYLVKKSVWIIGGDGWAYDIDYGGVDHVLASGKNVNILVLDTQVYSNTGGQQSKATFTGAVAKFAAGGKPQLPKDLAMMAMAYGNVYVARVAMGANDAQTLKALREAEAYEGVSIIIAYAHCIAHGYDMRYGMKQQKKAVECGLWPLMRYNPTLSQPMTLDYKEPKIDVKEYMYNEARFKMVEGMDHEKAEAFLETARFYAKTMHHNYWRFLDECTPNESK
ncbi:MAG TPA: 4Fe-4S dicluster domain-containing protein, partial [Campylobacterales bacterium]|nr:4Fe-4S dicluster domain-containing protein [Campylobacterales bacterium]